MKCRDMNPGNRSECRATLRTHAPSMKCRDMNPGNGTRLNAVDLLSPPQ